MKKTVSTAIGGVVFHIEEDAYQALAAYLEQVQRYFATFSEGREIVRDIEARIAELFAERLKAHNREAIVAEDVTAIVATMGTVADFAAAEPEEGMPNQQPYEGGPQTAGNFAEPQVEGAQASGWQRSRRDKVVSGVLGGLAAKLGIDALWLRVAFCVFAVGLGFLPAFPVVLIVGYFILAVSMPVSTADDDLPPNIRKLYREPQGQVIGGVAGGLAAFLGLDVSLVRVLFGLSIFLGGSGIVVYLLLWALTPPAQTMTDRMRMRGEPITLSGISDKLSAGPAAAGSQSKAHRLLLLPFALLGQLARALMAVALGLVRVFGAFIGIILFVLALSLMAVGAAFAWQMIQDGTLLGSDFIHFEGDDDFGAYLMQAPGALVYAGSALAIFLGLDLLLLAMALIAARNVAGRYLNVTAVALTIICAVATLVLLPKAARTFKEKEVVTTQARLPLKSSAMLQIAVPEVSAENSFRSDRLSLVLAEAQTDSLSVVQSVEGRGATRALALASAAEVRYGFSLSNDSVLALAPAFTWAAGRPYRMQKLDLKVLVPPGRVFRLDERAARLAMGSLAPLQDDYSADDFAGRKLVFAQGRLSCLDCPAKGAEPAEPAAPAEPADGFDARIDISTDSGRVKGKIDEVTINKNGIETWVKDPKTGKRTRVRIQADTAE